MYILIYKAALIGDKLVLCLQENGFTWDSVAIFMTVFVGLKVGLHY